MQNAIMLRVFVNSVKELHVIFMSNVIQSVFNLKVVAPVKNCDAFFQDIEGKHSHTHTIIRETTERTDSSLKHLVSTLQNIFRRRRRGGKIS
jgi:hypothetical protein